MPQFYVDEDLAALVEKLAKPKPFENLSFNSALRRVLLSQQAPERQRSDAELESLLEEALSAAKLNAKKASSPNPSDWAAMIPELRAKKGLNSWKSICDMLSVDPAGDSARRKLKKWVEVNRPKWPPVPDIDQ